MPSFAFRSYEKELLDGEHIPFGDIQRNMQELNFINTWLGGHAITLKGFKKTEPAVFPAVGLHLAEIGCGGGDNMRVIKNAWQKKGRSMRLTGIDINPECIQYAKSLQKNAGINFICSDYKNVVFETKPHIIFSSLFCHHFTDGQLVAMLEWMHKNSSLGFFINDLHRHPVAYYTIKGLTSIFSKSYLVKNDAPLSVQRGFTKKEWQLIFSQAGIEPYHCTWQWAFRWLITYRHAD